MLMRCFLRVTPNTTNVVFTTYSNSCTRLPSVVFSYLIKMVTIIVHVQLQNAKSSESFNSLRHSVLSILMIQRAANAKQSWECEWRTDLEDHAIEWRNWIQFVVVWICVRYVLLWVASKVKDCLTNGHWSSMKQKLKIHVAALLLTLCVYNCQWELTACRALLRML